MRDRGRYPYVPRWADGEEETFDAYLLPPNEELKELARKFLIELREEDQQEQK
jgi:hypothetical protein